MITVTILDGKENKDRIRELREKKWVSAMDALNAGDLVACQRLLKELSVLCSELKEFDMAVAFFSQAEKIGRMIASTRAAVQRT